MTADLRLDILFLADGRFEGGASTALAAEIRAADRAGIRSGLMLVKGALLRSSFPVHPDLQALIDAGATALVDPALRLDVGLVLIHHPLILTYRPTQRLAIRAKAVVIVLHHPAIDGVDKPQYDLTPVVAHAVSAFGRDVMLAPVSPVVRQSLPRRLPSRARLIDEDWTNLIDFADWPARRAHAPAWPVVIGRHARPDIAKWPDTIEQALLAYPLDASRYRVRILGAGPYLSEAYGVLPRNWEEEPFSLDGVSDFLQGLDFYVYFHSSSWSEAFGRTILEALATGLVVILPEQFEPLFGEAALYCALDGVEDVIAGFVAAPESYAEQSQRARASTLAHFGLAQFPARLDRLFPWLMADDHAPYIATSAFLTPERVLFISTNGIGLGHLTQQLALAERLPPEIQSVFATMSQGMRIVREAGYLTHFLSYHRYLNVEHERWNTALAEELFELIGFTQPRLVAYDGTMPFSGLLDALSAYREIQSLWVRRPMWRPFHAMGMPGSSRFDLIAEPGELADDFDHGPTKPQQPHVYRVPHQCSTSIRRRACRVDKPARCSASAKTIWSSRCNLDPATITT